MTNSLDAALFPLELAAHQRGETFGGFASLKQDRVHLPEDRRLDRLLRAEIVERLRRAITLDDRAPTGEQLVHAVSLAEAAAEFVVAAPCAVTGGHEIAESAESDKCHGARAER